MAKFGLPVKSSSKTINFRAPKRMVTLIDGAMKTGGYNNKQRSRWISEAIDTLLLRPDYANLVAEEFITPGTTTPLSVTTDEQLVARVDEAVEVVMTDEGVVSDKSGVIRTAILHRILNEKNAQLAPTEVPQQTELL